MSRDASSRRGVTRRGFLTVAVSAIVAGVVAGVGAYYAATLSAPAGVTKTITTTVTAATSTTTTTPPPAKEAPKTIKIGYVGAFTGVDAVFGQYDAWVLSYTEKAINEKGGVYLKEYDKNLPVQIVFRDSQSDPAIASARAEELITREGVTILTTTHDPWLTVPVITIAEKYGIPCIVSDSPIEGTSSAGPFQWSYVFFFDESELAWAFGQTWKNVVNKLPNKIAGGMWNNDIGGLAFMDPMIRYAREAGFTIGTTTAVPYGVKDYSDVISKWISERVDLFIGNMIAADFNTLWRQCYAKGFRPPVATMARAVLFPAAVEALGGDLPVGLTTELWFSPAWPWRSSITGETAREYVERFENETGRQWCSAVGPPHAVFEVAVDVLKRAGTLDKYKIREAIAETNMETIMGPVNFKDFANSPVVSLISKDVPIHKNLDHFCAMPFVIGQWLKGEKWPFEIKVVYNGRYTEIPIERELVLIK